MPRSTVAFLAFAGAVLPSLAAADQTIVVDLNRPTLDRWMYPFNQEPGTRAEAMTFGALGIPDFFDDRDAQFIIGFDTIPTVPAGLGLAAYQIQSARLTVTISTDETSLYDPTFDSFETYLDEQNGLYEPDGDEGRPIEVYGLGFRNGFGRFSFQESTVFSFGDPTLEGVRNAYALGYLPNGDPVDISNNVRDQFEVTPFAIGQIDGLAPGSPVPSESDVTFDLDLTNPDVVRYLQSSLNDGRLLLTVSSLHDASQGGQVTYPRYYTKENGLSEFFDYEARLDLEVIIPDAATPAVLTDATVIFGSLLSGGLDELNESDDQRLRTRSQFGFSALDPDLMIIRIGAETEIAQPAELEIAIESRINTPNGVATVRLRNFQTGGFQTIQQYPNGTTEKVKTISGVDATNRVRASDGRIELEVKHVVAAAFSALGFDSSFDLVAISVSE